MTITATEYPMVPADATTLLEERGFKVLISTENSLEAGDGVQVLQAIRLDDGEYRLARIPLTSEADFATESVVVPEIGEVLKWIEAQSARD